MTTQVIKAIEVLSIIATVRWQILCQLQKWYVDWNH